jgi:putative effector of murein hydrolase
MVHLPNHPPTLLPLTYFLVDSFDAHTYTPSLSYQPYSTVQTWIRDDLGGAGTVIASPLYGTVGQIVDKQCCNSFANNVCTFNGQLR